MKANPELIETILTDDFSLLTTKLKVSLQGNQFYFNLLDWGRVKDDGDTRRHAWSSLKPSFAS